MKYQGPKQTPAALVTVGILFLSDFSALAAELTGIVHGAKPTA